MGSTHRRLLCRVDEVGDGWDVVHVPGAVIADSEMFFLPAKEVGNDGSVDVEVLSLDENEALVRMPGTPMTSGTDWRCCRVVASALVA